MNTPEEGPTMKNETAAAAVPGEAPRSREPFGPVIYAYTRRQALEDGGQVDVSETAREAGIRFPVYLTRAVWNAYVEVPPGVHCQDEAGRLWDLVWMFAVAARRTDGADLLFRLYVRNDNRRPRLVTLKATCGPRDIDDPAPAITIMQTDED
jgi:hypothetical protein